MHIVGSNLPCRYNYILGSGIRKLLRRPLEMVYYKSKGYRDDLFVDQAINVSNSECCLINYVCINLSNQIVELQCRVSSEFVVGCWLFNLLRFWGITNY